MHTPARDRHPSTWWVWGLHLGQLWSRPSLQQSVPCPKGQNREQERGERCGEDRAPPRSPPHPSPHTGKRVGCTSGAATQLSAPEALGLGVLLGPKGSPEVGLAFLKPPSLGNFVLSQPLTSLHPSQKAGSRTRGLGLPPAGLCQQRQTLALEHTFWSDHPFNDGLSKHQHEPQPNSVVTAPGQKHLRPLRHPSSPDSCHGLSQGPLHGSCSGIWPQPEWERVGMESPDVRSSLNCVNWGESHYLSEPQFLCGGCPYPPQRVAMENSNSKC